jgi:hypothetical protein
MDIAPEEWLFARHALQWICFHQDIYEDKHALSMHILLNATELSTCNESQQEGVFEYDAERLRYTLGSLVTVDERNMVFLAHYTVREYLQSPRISDSIVRCFQIGQKTKTSKLMQIVVQKAQGIEWTEEKDELMGDSCKRKTPDAFLQDFAAYCVISSMMMMLTMPDTIASDGVLLSLVSNFMNPTLAHYSDASRVCLQFQDTALFFSDQDQNATESMEFPRISTNSDDVEHVILLHLMLLSRVREVPVLAEAFSRERDITALSQAHVKFSFEVDEGDGYIIQNGLYDLDGSLLEVMAQLSRQFRYSFTWILDQSNRVPEISLLLPAIVSHHMDSHGVSDNLDRCWLEKILDRGADPNATRHSITPLQIAAATRDVKGIEELLIAGANPNATGNLNGVCFETNCIVSWCSELSGLSPLYICRDFTSLAWQDDGCFSQKEMEEMIERDIPLVEALLLQYGAEEYLSSP